MGVLDGKVALVTGASRGIGAAIARRLAAEGAAVAVSARTTADGESRFAGTIAETVAGIETAGAARWPCAPISPGRTSAPSSCNRSGPGSARSTCS